MSTLSNRLINRDPVRARGPACSPAPHPYARNTRATASGNSGSASAARTSAGGAGLARPAAARSRARHRGRRATTIVITSGLRHACSGSANSLGSGRAARSGRSRRRSPARARRRSPRRDRRARRSAWSGASAAGRARRSAAGRCCARTRGRRRRRAGRRCRRRSAGTAADVWADEPRSSGPRRAGRGRRGRAPRGDLSPSATACAISADCSATQPSSAEQRLERPADLAAAGRARHDQHGGASTRLIPARSDRPSRRTRGGSAAVGDGSAPRSTSAKIAGAAAHQLDQLATRASARRAHLVGVVGHEPDQREGQLELAAQHGLRAARLAHGDNAAGGELRDLGRRVEARAVDVAVGAAVARRVAGVARPPRAALAEPRRRTGRRGGSSGRAADRRARRRTCTAPRRAAGWR